MKITIVGAGIGGLSTAIALARPPHSHTVTLLESAARLAEVGAGVQLGPNATRLWFAWGLGPDILARAALPQRLVIHRWQDGRVLAQTTVAGAFETRYGAPYVVVHRAELHAVLHAHAVALGAKVRTGCRVVDYDVAAGTCVLEGGEVVQADLVVAVDGINSFARTKFVCERDARAPEPTGWAAFRMMVDVHKIRADPDTAWIVERPKLHLWAGDGHSAMTYMVSGATALNVVLSHRDDVDTTAWTEGRMKEEIAQQFAGWDPCVGKLIAMARPNPQNWPVFQAQPLEKWASDSGRFVLMGDAAHAMAFYLSMGVAMAVEDAAALAESLSFVAAGSLSLRSALSVFELSRLRRTRSMRAASLEAGRVVHLADGPEQEARDAAMQPGSSGETEMKNPYGLTDPQIRNWCFGFDVVEEIRRELEARVNEEED